jgi:hypothetical protein
MNKIMKRILLSSLTISLLYLVACTTSKPATSQPTVQQNTKVAMTSNYMGSYFNGNYVWGGAMNLTWNELNDNILHEELKLKTEEKLALEMVAQFNNPAFTKNDLDDKSYYVKSGYGQKTVEEINRECKKKFPSKSFDNLNLSLAPTDIISYSYLLKELAYKIAFEKKEMSFNGQKVKGFYAKEMSQKENVEILHYENPDKFIIRLSLKDDNDQLVLAKGYDMTNPQGIVEEVNQNNKLVLPTLGKMDIFEAPELHLKYHRDYIELIGKALANKGFEKYQIAQMFENIAFDMDEKGARVENEAAIILSKSINLDPPKKFILDKPYWVIMLRKDTTKPYFILGVNNTECMQKP